MANRDEHKRTLKFQSFDEMFSEIEQLQQGGYVSRGNWNLAQTCGHIGEWMRYPVDGFPVPPFWMRPIFWIMKVTVGQSMKRKILSEGFKGGMPTAPPSVPAADAMTDLDAISQLRETVTRVTSHAGELIPSPLFGPMDMEMLKTVTLLHAAHHLGYLAPKPE
ncbi:MAG: DUF1569 domain-containing protein [Planctomycetota bacterium]